MYRHWLPANKRRHCCRVLRIFMCRVSCAPCARPCSMKAFRYGRNWKSPVSCAKAGVSAACDRCGRTACRAGGGGLRGLERPTGGGNRHKNPGGTPVRGQIIEFDAPPGLVQRILYNGKHYLFAHRAGQIVVGSTRERVGFDRSLTQTALTELMQVAQELLPVLKGVQSQRHWSGLRPGSADGHP